MNKLRNWCMILELRFVPSLFMNPGPDELRGNRFILFLQIHLIAFLVEYANKFLHGEQIHLLVH